MHQHTDLELYEVFNRQLMGLLQRRSDVISEAKVENKSGHDVLYPL
jgi:hypothetical protein